MTNWVQALQSCAQNNQSHSLITVLATSGSTPRAVGAKMVVTQWDNFDTIGGGALEHQAIKLARKHLSQNQTGIQQISFNLSKDLKQCCGGKITLLIENFQARSFRLHLFGAGHIAHAMLPTLKNLGWQINWYDNRSDLFPATLPAHIQTHNLKQVDRVIESAQSDDYYLIMTHDHALDQSLCEAIISRGDAAFCGLIGSAAKRNKFKTRLMKKGFTQQEFDQITCPIGLKQINGKTPTEIAISVLGQLLSLQSASTAVFTSVDLARQEIA